MNPYVFQQVKELVTMTDILEHYGISVNRNLALCPFHSEKTPSLRVYNDNFYCYGCGVGGDLIKFVSMYQNVSNHEAVKIINEAFGLGIEIDGKVDFRSVMKYETKKREKKRLELLREHYLNVLTEYHRWLWKQQLVAEPESPEWFESLLELGKIDYYIDCVLEDIKGFKAVNKKVVSVIEQRNIVNRRVPSDNQ